MGGQETKGETFLWGVDSSRHHVIILGTGNPVLHSFLWFYEHVRNWKMLVIKKNVNNV